MFDVSTIIVSYNTFEMTRDAVSSAMKSGEGLAQEVIVVDNASPDQTAERLRAAFPSETHPDIQIIANAHNPGFSAANNQGAAVATGRVLFFLNPDTLVKGDAIPQLVDLLEARHDIGAAGPRVLNGDGSDQPSTFPFVSARYLLWHHLPLDALLRGEDRRSDAIPTASGPVDVLKGCALALRREVFDEVGGWDEAYFMYSEETELCFALSGAGYINWFLREAEITHFGGASTRDRYAEYQVVHQRSVVQFLRRRGRGDLVLLNRIAGTLGFGLRIPIFGALSTMRPSRAEDYRLRGAAARRLARWFLTEYA